MKMKWFRKFPSACPANITLVGKIYHDDLTRESLWCGLYRDTKSLLTLDPVFFMATIARMWNKKQFVSVVD